MSLSPSALGDVFRALITSRIIYALPSYSGSVSQADKDRINTLLRKAKRWGLTQDEIDFDTLSTLADTSLFCKIVKQNQCLHQLIPSCKKTKYNLRPRCSNFKKRSHSVRQF